MNKYNPPVKILDLGGTQEFWENMGLISDKILVTIINKEQISATYENFIAIRKDASDLSELRDKDFDIVFSNSLIEHLIDYNAQKQMARDIIRIGKSYFIQTPNYYFPFEPHFLFPFFQFFPYKFKIYLLQHFNLGWFEKCDKDEAEKIINNIHLLKIKQLKSLFPDSVIVKEKLLGFTTSFTCYGI